jgi:hypothetical protein
MEGKENRAMDTEKRVASAGVNSRMVIYGDDRLLSPLTVTWQITEIRDIIAG